VAFVADMLGDHRAYKHPQALYRHAEEHLRWTTRKLRTAPTRRLRQAAADGLNAYLERLEAEVDALPEIAASLVDPVRAARAALTKAPGTRVDALRRQRLLRIRAASLCAIANVFGKLSPWQALSR
jgi:hypothetical protein